MMNHTHQGFGTPNTTENTPKSNTSVDPFDEPLEDQLLLTDTYFAAARTSVTIDGMDYSFLKPPHMSFEDNILTKRKLKEAYTQREFLLLTGYSGCGKTTVLTDFADKYPHYIHLLKNLGSLSPAQMLQQMGKCVHVPLVQRTSEIFTLQEHLTRRQGIMFLFDEATADTPSARLKLDILRKIHMETHVPIVFSGTPKLYKSLYDSRYYDDNCSIITRLDEHEMHGMRREDAGAYLNMVAEAEHLRYTYPAQQALIDTALNTNIGGIHALTTVLGRCITLARALYYKEPGRSFPDNTQCVRPVVPDGKNYPGAKLILTLPATPEPVLIDEGMVNNLLSEYKACFPKVLRKR